MELAVSMLFCTTLVLASGAQQTPAELPAHLPELGAMEELNPLVREQVQAAIRARDYLKAEQILVGEIDRHPKSSEMLRLAGVLFFLDHKYLNAAIALKKAEVIAPLSDQDRFTLAMSYVILDHRDWARPELEKLADNNPRNPLYFYWLARLDYDAQQFPAAVEKLTKVIEMDPAFMKAYDNLGLCYEALGKFDEAEKTYQQAVLLNRKASPGSPWPPDNLGAMLMRQENFADAEQYLRESLRIDPNFPQAHYHLGLLLEKQNKDAEAIRELEKASAIDAAYAQPHYALGRIYRRKQETGKADAEFALFQKLKQDKPARFPR